MTVTGLGAEDPRIAEAMQAALDRGEVGVQVAAYLDNELIVDVAAGTRNGSDPVTSNTLFQPFSITKAVTATAVNVLVARGLLRYGDRVADHWPEYAAN